MKRQRLNKLTHAERAELCRRPKDAVEACYIHPNHNEFGSPFFVRKVYGSLRLCVDYRGLDEVTRKDAYQLPRVADTLDELKDANLYTLQIPMCGSLMDNAWLQSQLRELYFTIVQYDFICSFHILRDLRVADIVLDLPRIDSPGIEPAT
jgi:hypothetical protein